MVEKFIFANVDDDRYFFVSDDYDLNYCTHTKQQWMVWYVRGYITVPTKQQWMVWYVRGYITVPPQSNSGWYGMLEAILLYPHKATVDGMVC